MASAARPAHTPSKPVDEARLILRAADALVKITAELRTRLLSLQTSRTGASVLLAEAHISEAVGILRSAVSKPPAESPPVLANRPSAAA
jgi:hypothetical protein